jgi:hypothetical protein
MKKRTTTSTVAAMALTVPEARAQPVHRGGTPAQPRDDHGRCDQRRQLG